MQLGEGGQDYDYRGGCGRVEEGWLTISIIVDHVSLREIVYLADLICPDSCCDVEGT